ncbi:MAG: undecaprenyldiphospho-muramoylpentapeptide beta-N-acetylglucosaminyltransferase [Firmicutes bacterium]|jgi:UDP-N-acetylglucosamine--N-acetylmuramyl-(pentapeptide) pyrophosphoryl-undecaprenol N-acetylglucosamine transferase|nr:undecaprenyldiphospho-muramoylpentapeptide beta-N-acetylglucosaminyltransferase [Bacillota bacterium]MDH7496415.1 undecaprenyldiphospho-muramoylpentapeptide beta-N-acetylglucosaminyltransferase [Bacillota bacterium]
MKALFAGGGTGGHVYPAITVARALLERDPAAKVIFVGTRRGLEADIVPKEGFVFHTIEVAGLHRRLSPGLVLTALGAFKGLAQSIQILLRERPDVVVGTGGYVSGPVVLAAWMLGIPTLIHEQNALPGLTTRMLSRIASAVAVTYHESARCLARKSGIVVTGNPVRKAIITADRQEGARAMGLDPDRPTLLVFGGSQGARAINEAMVAAVPDLLARNRDLQVIHQTGRRDHEWVLEELERRGVGRGKTSRLVVEPYLYEMHMAMACADLVVSRAGAISIAEITARGLPAVLVPFPGAAEGHQEKNARALESAGAAVVILQSELTGDFLRDTVEALLRDRAKLEGMSRKSRGLGRPRAADDLADLAGTLASRRHGPRTQAPRTR